MNALLQDLRYAVRQLTRAPGSTVVIVVCLAVGIGANTAIFSIVDAVLLRSLPYSDPERLVMIWGTPPQRPDGRAGVNVSSYLAWREMNPAFDEIGVVHTSVPVNLDSSEHPERVDAQIFSWSLFHVLGVQPVLGRTFRPEEDRFGAEPVVVLGFGLWQRRFAGDPDVLGKTLPVDSEVSTIIGVMPPGFNFYNRNAELWRPFRWDPKQMQSATRYLLAAGRIKPTLTLEQAQAEADLLARRLEEVDPANQGWGIKLEPMREAMAGNFRSSLFLLMAAVGFVLLIACVNVASLLVGRATARQQEIAVRSALGAGRGRLIRQLLTESILLGLVGGLLGLLLAYFGLNLLVAATPLKPDHVDVIAIDLRILTFTLLLTFLTALVAGLAPALWISRPNLSETLKEGGRASTGAPRQRLRSVLVASEIALSLVLLAGAGLMINSFVRLQSVHPGFETENLHTFQIKLPQTRYCLETPDEPLTKHGVDATILSPGVSLFFEQVRERLQALPGVRSVAGITWLPLNGYWAEARTFLIEGRPAPGQGERPFMGGYHPVTPNFFQTMKIPLIRGRYFTGEDRAESPWVTIIDESMARQYWPDQEPIGQFLTVDIIEEEKPREIVGIVGNVHHWDLTREPGPNFYVPHTQQPLRYPANRRRGRLQMSYILETSSPGAVLQATVRQAVDQVDSTQPVFAFKRMERYVSEAVAGPRFYSSLFGIFAAIALLLAAVGIYGVMSFFVTQRTHEIGIRMALGCRQLQVIAWVIRRSLSLVALGLAAGLALAFAATRLISSYLYGVSATDPLTFAIVALLLAAIAVLASYLPARRAARVEPMIALRHE